MVFMPFFNPTSLERGLFLAMSILTNKRINMSEGFARSSTV